MQNTGLFEVRTNAAGGMLVLLFANIGATELLHTIVIAGTGVLASITVSMTMRWLMTAIRQVSNSLKKRGINLFSVQ